MGRLRTCRSTAADRQDCSWVGPPSDPEIQGTSRQAGQRGCRSAPLHLWARRQVIHDPAPKDGEADDRGTGSWDVERARVHNLPAAAELLERAATAPAGRAPLTLVLGTEAPLKQTLLAFRGGVRLAEHDAPGAAMLQVLQGRVRLVTSEESWALGHGATRCRSRPPGIGWRARRTLPPTMSIELHKRLFLLVTGSEK
jgi:quercetin dioxygenase-like cupin family protein